MDIASPVPIQIECIAMRPSITRVSLLLQDEPGVWAFTALESFKGIDDGSGIGFHREPLERLNDLFHGQRTELNIRNNHTFYTERQDLH